MVNYLCYNESMRDELVEVLREAREIVDEAWNFSSGGVAKDYVLSYVVSYLLQQLKQPTDKSEATAFALLGAWLDHNKEKVSREQIWEAYNYFLSKLRGGVL